MDSNKYNLFLEKMLNLNIKIDTNIYKFTKFIDEDAENKFQKEREQKEKYQKVMSDIILICGHIASSIYIIFAFYKQAFLLLCLSCFFINSILMTMSYFIKDRKILYILDNIEIFLICLSLNIKGNLLNFIYNTPLDDNYAELVRIIIYDFLSTNLFILIKLEAHILTSLFYFILNIILIIMSSINSNVNRFYFLEGFTSFILTFMFFLLRKAWDYRARVIYAEKYKLEGLYKYTTDFIIGLNAYHVNINNDDIVYSDDKLNYLLKDTRANCEDFRKLCLTESQKNTRNKDTELNSQLNILETKNYLIDVLEINNENNVNKQCLNNYSTNRSEDIIDFQEHINLKCFLKNLFLYIDESEVEVTTAITAAAEKDHLSINNNKNKKNQEEQSSFKNKGIFANNEQIKKESLFSHLDKIKKDEFSYLQENNSINYEGEIEKLNIMNVNNELKKTYKYNRKLAADSAKKDIQFISKNTNNNKFVNLGIYHFKNPEIGKYLDVFYRGISIDDSTIVYDILFYDVTEIIKSKKIIYEENIIKQKVLAKIAHEFKTPINSIIGLINNLKENLHEDHMLKDEKENDNPIEIFNSNHRDFNNNKENETSKQVSKNLKTLDIIENLSRYIIFLVSDIIQFSGIKDMNQINIQNKKVNLKEIANFSFEILKCLIKCNLLKYKNVKIFLKYDEILDKIIIKIDEIRLKQIILNLISNAVKFTKCGNIKITFKLEKNEGFLKIIIRDTGIGIKDSDKEKLFNDFVMLGDGINLNSQGSGLGLSICKSLAYKMKLKLNFKSEYGSGSKFFIQIPVNNDSHLHKSSNNLNKSLDKFRNQMDLGPYNRYLQDRIRPGSLSARELNIFNVNKLDKVIFL